MSNIKQYASVLSRLIAIKHCKPIYRYKINKELKSFISCNQSYDIVSLVKPFNFASYKDHFILALSLNDSVNVVKKRCRFFDSVAGCNYFAVAVPSKIVQKTIYELRDYPMIGILDSDKISWCKFPKFMKVDEACINTMFDEFKIEKPRL